MSSWLKHQRVVTLDTANQEVIAFEAHKKIFDAIAAKYPDGAEHAMREHLLQLQTAYWDHEHALKE